MDTPWRSHRLPELVAALAGRPGHNETGSLVAELLRHAFGASYLEIDQEVRLPEYLAER